MPFFLLMAATAYLAPSVSVTANADRLPVSGSIQPSLIDCSPRALMMYGDATCNAPTVAPACNSRRRPILKLPMLELYGIPIRPSPFLAVHAAVLLITTDSLVGVRHVLGNGPRQFGP